MKRISALLAILLLLSACQTFGTRQPLAPNVDLSRYAGRWYVIANIPYFAERGNVGSYFEISFPDGKVRDVYYGRSGGFDAELSRFVMTGYVVEGTGNAYWRETPLWPIYLSYLILHVSPDYETALVGYPGRQYGWILARQPRMDDDTYTSLLGRFAALGYDPAMFQRIPQFPDQLGKPGFMKP
jgi:apolipoprotein D and lipocalin family protein